MPEQLRWPGSDVSKIDAIRSAAPRALNFVGLAEIGACQITVVDVTDPENPTVIITGGEGEEVTYHVQPAGLSPGSNGEIYELVAPPDMEQ